MKRLLFAILSLFAINGLATDYYAASGNPATGAALSSAVMRAEFTSIAAGFAKIAPYTGNGNKLIAINSGATAQTAITTGTGILTALGINVGSAGAPVLFNGAGGTPSSLTLTNATGLPIGTGVAGLGTGIATALAINVGSAGAPVLFNGAGGTPSSIVLTNATGTAASLTAGLAQGLTGTPNITVGTIGATSLTFTGQTQLSNYLENTYTPSFTNFTVVNGTGGVTYSGVYTRIGRLVFWQAKATTSGTATIAATKDSSNISLPTAASGVGAGGATMIENGSGVMLGAMLIYSGSIAYAGSDVSATNNGIIASGWYYM